MCSPFTVYCHGQVSWTYSLNIIYSLRKKGLERERAERERGKINESEEDQNLNISWKYKVWIRITMEIALLVNSFKSEFPIDTFLRVNVLLIVALNVFYLKNNGSICFQPNFYVSEKWKKESEVKNERKNQEPGRRRSDTRICPGFAVHSANELPRRKLSLSLLCFSYFYFIFTSKLNVRFEKMKWAQLDLNSDIYVAKEFLFSSCDYKKRTLTFVI